ncbi:DUF2911 domain-containing protein [Gillisia sp. JM1]|uniref:DUF2911 domain-containing protein n=1 Tax=Gillisia sp. JM1 TaxID=1283286 RepID=UPI0004214398|nr:DUF2911 domain-containing protein [Gillisia sp. JM1]
MKKIFLLVVIAIFTLQSSSANAQEKTKEAPSFNKMDVSPMDLVVYKNEADEVVARVIYSRPLKRDREIFGKLVPYNEVWRTGANEATELTLYKDMKVADAVVEAGTYTLYTIPGEKEWTVILNNRTNTWGAYEYSDQEDRVRIKVPVRNAPSTIESFSMAFVTKTDGADLLMGWDNKYVEVPFKAIQ